MEQTLTTSLLDNKLALKGLFGTATDFYTKDITLMGYPACICMFEGLSSIERLWIMMLDVLSKPDVQPETPEELFDYILKQTAIPLESKSVVCVEDARAQLTAGTSVILIDGVARGLVLSTFQSVGYTERPDTACAKICEGKIIIMANGSPFAMIVPYFFNENFQSMDDYSEKAYFASLIRILKYSAFLIAVMLPGVFVSVANFTPELLPPELLYKVASAELATPLPLFMEALFVNFLLEIVREAGLRLPKPIGHSVSLVAALIVGDAAVSAGIVGTPVVIVAAMTAICTFVVPSLYEPITVLRILYILAGGLLGPLGIVTLLFCMLLGMCGMNSFGIPYTAPIAPGSSAFWRDGLLRRNWHTLARADFSIDQLPGKETGETQ